MTVSSGAIPAVQLRRPVGDQALPTRAGWAIMCQPEWLRIQCSHLAQGQPLSEPGGSACCYWNRYGTWCM